eukprot:TRINITY_DN22482_c0_g1_i1.p1 TRINITY_DN22482_c0_g1~~TRINITY_DN22482_c0_g1_i1.p1  ORF type:complete len:655 (-),score=199.59 TRINITY_DN22482_c0_g1_i1:12-1976(-)
MEVEEEHEQEQDAPQDLPFGGVEVHGTSRGGFNEYYNEGGLSFLNYGEAMVGGHVGSDGFLGGIGAEKGPMEMGIMNHNGQQVLSEEEPLAKRTKLSLEVVPEKKIIRYAPDGEEETQPEIKPDEKFLKLVKQLDFWNHDKENFEEEQKKEKNSWEDARIKVHDHLNQAVGQINFLVDFILMLEAGINLTLVECDKPPPPPKIEQDEFIYQVVSKKKHLRDASQKLSMAVERLKVAVEQENKYFESVRDLRKRWKIGSLYQIQNNRIPLFTVDYSYDNDGSRLSRETNYDLEIKKNDDGDIEVSVPTLKLDRYLLVGKQPIGDTFQTEFVKSGFNGDTLQIKETVLIRTAVGIEATHKLLSESQRSLFVYEIYATLSKAVKKSFVQLMENEIKLETNGKHPFSIKLLSPTRKIEEKDYSPLSLAEKTIFNIIEVKLHQLMRQKYTKQQLEDHRIRYSKDYIKANEVDLDSPVLEEMVDLYKHISLQCELRSLLDTICINIPHITLSWINTPDPLVTSCDLLFDYSYYVAITVLKTKILISNVELYSVEDLEQYLLHLFTRKTMDHIQNAVTSLELPQLAGYQSLSVSLPNKYVLNFKVSPQLNKSILMDVVATNPLTSQEYKIDWEKVPGKNHYEKTIICCNLPHFSNVLQKQN